MEVDPNAEYREIGIRSFGRGVFHKPLVRGIELGEKRVFRIEPGDLLFNNVFAWEGAVAVAGQSEAGMIGSHRFITCLPDRSKVDEHFLYWWFCTSAGREQLALASPGGAGRNRTLGVEKLAVIEVPLPSLAEQRAIAESARLLSTAADEVASLRDRSVAETDAAISSIRRQVFGSEPGSDWVALGSVVERLVGGVSPSTEGRPATSEERGVLKVGAVSFGRFEPNQNKALPADFKVNEDLEVRVGDFIMSRANTLDLVGACAVVRNTRPGLFLSDKTWRFVFRNGEKVDLGYLEHLLKAPVIRSQIERAASGTSPTMKNIAKERVLALLIPTHTHEQQVRIAARLSAVEARIDGLLSTQRDQFRYVRALLPSYISRAFDAAQTVDSHG